MKVKFEQLKALDRFTYNGTKFQKLNDHQGRCQSYDQATPFNTMVFFDPKKIVEKINDN